MAMAAFSIGVAALRRQLGATQAFLICDVFDPENLYGAVTRGESSVAPGAEASIEGQLESIHKGVVVTATVGAPWVGECRRCALAIGGALEVAVRERFLEGASDEDEAYPLEGEILDLFELVRDSLLLELPIAPLCRQDCKGLCVTCGADRNEGDCGCDPPMDPRWASLETLRSPDQA
jgi:uncharacterized protein